jgi:anti-anti-sigma factor
MMTTELSIDRVESADGSTVVLALHGELDLASAGRLREALAALTAETVLIHLHDLSFMDSSGLAVLLDAKRRGDRRGRSVRFDGATGDVRYVLERTGTLGFIEAPEPSS